MNGVNDGVRREFGIQPVLGSKWFIVSMEWIQKWRAYVGLENSDSPAHPGAIDNSDIIS